MNISTSQIKETENDFYTLYSYNSDIPTVASWIELATNSNNNELPIITSFQTIDAILNWFIGIKSTITLGPCFTVD